MRYWKRVDTDGNITTVESYSHDLDVDGAIEITKEEFDECIASLPVTPPLEPLVFTASPPGEALGERLNNIEAFLREAYPE